MPVDYVPDYDEYPPTPDKVLQPDGSIVSIINGTVIAPANATRANQYLTLPVLAAKYMLPDGSIINGVPINTAIEGTPTPGYSVTVKDATGALIYAEISAVDQIYSVTDPTANQATSTAVIDEYTGSLITLTTTGVTQTLQAPTDTDPGSHRFIVINDNLSTNSITVNGVVLVAGTSCSWIWDGTVWVVSGAVLDSALIYKGAISCGANPNYPAADAGHTYIIDQAGKIGGASGTIVAIGDMAICKVNGSAAGTQAAVGANWNIIEKNIDLGNITITGGSIDGTPVGQGTPASGQFSPLKAKGPAAITSFATTASKSTTVLLFPNNANGLADAVKCGYDATNPVLGTTVVLGGVTMVILSWTNAYTANVDVTGNIGAATITSAQGPIAWGVDSSGVLAWAVLANRTFFMTSPDSSAFTDVLVNVLAKSSGNLIDLQVAGVSRFLVTSVGHVYLRAGVGIYWGAQSSVLDSSGDLMLSPGSGNLMFVGAGKQFLLPDAGKITYDVDLADDHTATGDIASYTAGEQLYFGDVCYLNADGKWYKTDADAAATMPGTAMAIASITAAAAGLFLLKGWARDNSAWAGMTKGGTLYASTTAGALTQTAPSGDADCIQILGKATSLNSATVGMIRFEPESIMVEVGLDIEAKDSGYTITWAELTAVPKTFTCITGSAGDKTFTFAAPTAADVGKQFRLVKTDAGGTGKVILDAPTGVTIVNSVGASSDGGTATSEASKCQSILFMCVSATVVQQLGAADGTWTLA